MEYASVTTSLARDQQTYALDNLGPLKLGDRVPFLVYEQWKKLRDQLSSIVDDYVDACDALAGVASLANQPAIESIFANIDRELNHLALEEIKLASGRRTLTMFRNMSSALCSINLLPDDVLTYILELSIFSYVQDDPLGRKQFLTCPGVFASVCTRWRHIAVNACCLWTHIDLIPTSDPSHKLYRRARIWLRRVKSAPLHVYIHQHDACVKREQIMQLTGFLAPLMKQLQTLHLSADCHTTDLFEEILGCWIEFGHPGSTKYLTLRRPNPTFLMAHPGLGARDQLSLGHLETRNSRQHLNKFLLPLRSLRLHNVYMGWGSAAHRGLSELHLEAIPDWAGLTICGLIAVIRGSPELSSLKISRVNLVDKDMEHEGASEPIQLNNLECLDLLGANPMVVKRLLPLIIPGTTPLSVSLKLYKQELIQTELQSFLERSNLSTLYLDAANQTWATAVFGGTPHLRSLAIRNYHFSRGSFHNPPPEEEAPICAPLLNSIYFIGCRVNLGYLKYMVTTRSGTLRSLKLWRSRLYADSLSDIPELDDGDVLDGISDLIPHVQRSTQMADYPVLGWLVCDELKGRNVSIPPD